MDYYDVKNKLDIFFDTDRYDLYDPSPREELRILKSRFLAQSRKRNTTYFRVLDIQRTLKLLKIKIGLIRMLTVEQIDNITDGKVDGFNSFMVRLAAHPEWPQMSSFFETREHIDTFVRCLVPCLERNETDTLNLLLSTNLKDSKSLIKLFKFEIRKNIRELWMEKLATPVDVNIAMTELEDQKYFTEWSQKFRFDGSTGGGGDDNKHKRTSSWIIRRYRDYHQKKIEKGTQSDAEDGEKVDPIDNGNDMKGRNEEVDVSMGTKKTHQVDRKSKTGSSSSDEEEARDSGVIMKVEIVSKGKEKGRRQSKDSRRKTKRKSHHTAKKQVGRLMRRAEKMEKVEEKKSASKVCHGTRAQVAARKLRVKSKK